MGKGTDKLYITHSEWNSSDAYSASSGSNVRDRSSNAAFKRLPFAYCALGLQPFATPVCTADGLVFDHENILRWLTQHDTNPVTGRPLRRADLIRLSLARNEAGEYVDPVTYKVLTDNSHVVAIRRHGDGPANVFAWDTIERLNIRAKAWRDLVTDEPFTRDDIITLQDPQNLESRNLSEFTYLKRGEDSLVPKDEASINTAAMGSAAELKIMKAKQAVARARDERNGGKISSSSSSSNSTTVKPGKPAAAATPTARAAPTPYNATRHTTGQAAASFTSTGLTPNTSAALALMTDEEYLLKPRRVRQKGYVRLSTTLGDLTLELMPEYAPKAVWNFIRLAQQGYYNGIIFHRNIRHFMIQTGDPTGTGRGGRSVWNKNFEDEFDGPNKHDARGVVSMANKGKNTNSSQFFITYRAASHLDRKHTIFGRVVVEEGDDVLKRLEEVEVDPTSKRPVDEVKIVEAVVLLDPFEEFMKAKEARDAAAESGSKSTDDDRTTWTGKRIRADGSADVDSAGTVGKYLNRGGGGNAGGAIAEEFDDRPAKKKARGGGGFGNFDGW